MRDYFSFAAAIRRTCRALVLSAVALLYAENTGAQQTRIRGGRALSQSDTTVAFDKNGSVTISATTGDIVVTGWTRNEVRVHTDGDGDFRFDATSSRVLIELVRARRGHDLRLEVSVPHGVRVIARAQSGDLSIRGTRGQVEAYAQSGDVDVRDATTRVDVTALSGDVNVAGVNGDVSVSTMSGDAAVTDVRGNVDVGAVSGDIDLEGIVARTVRAKTTSGDVSYDGTIDPAGRYELSTHSGDVNLLIPRNASAQLTVATWNGGIESQFPITLQPGQQSLGATRPKRFTFDIGDGTARISAETFSGDVNIGVRRQ